MDTSNARIIITLSTITEEMEDVEQSRRDRESKSIWIVE